jgi:hypothetical protein
MFGSDLCIPRNETAGPRVKNWIIMFCFPISTFMYLWAIYIFFESVCLFCCSQIGRPNLGIYKCDGMGSSPTCAAAASKALTAPAATAEPAEEGAELLYQQQQTSAPWYCQFCHCSNHPLREFCTMCLESKKWSIHKRSPPCGSDLCLIFILLMLSKNFVCLV